MKTIQRQISLEPMTSRLPSVWPAYRNNEPNIYYFDDEHLREREWAYTSNWGMVPVNIVVTPSPNYSHRSTDYQLVEGCHCYGGDYEINVGCSNNGESSYDKLSCGTDEEKFVLSFENLSHWYHFFTEYYNLLKGYGHCGRVYTSAEDYYNYESLTKYSDQMIYGSDKQTYLDLDEKFASMGGVVEVQVYKKDDSTYTSMTPTEAHDETSGDRMAMTDVYDVGFFKWICDNVVPSFVIPMKYRDYWKRNVLYYPDIIKWLAWFGERTEEYMKVFTAGTNGEVDLWDCKNEEIIDCCDCNEYFNRGGKKIYDEMKQWYDAIQETITSNNDIIIGSSNCFVPTVILPTELQITIDDLGEFSIFSKDYELGEDYRVTQYGDMTNTKGGTVATIDGKSVYLEKDVVGYSFDAECMEKYVSSCGTCNHTGVFFSKCPKCGSNEIVQVSKDDSGSLVQGAWISYTDKYICEEDCEHGNKNRDDFVVSAVTFYTYDENNVKYDSSANSEENAIEDLKNQMAKRYPIVTREGGWMLINGNIYEIIQSEYGEYYYENVYLGGNICIVQREEGTNTPYTYINGKKIFAEFYPLTNQYYFPFFTVNKRERGKFNINDYVTYDRVYNSENTIPCVKYNGTIYNITASTMDIDGYVSYAISGYALSDDDIMLYCESGSNKVIYDGYGVQYYPNSSADSSNITVEYDGDITLYRVDEITGETVSKVNDLRLYNTITDSVGNSIEGIYKVTTNMHNHQPPEGSELELIYQVGNTANISRFSKTKEDEDDITDNKNYFVGDIIAEMNFYYKDFAEEMVDYTLSTVKLLNDDKIRIEYYICTYNQSTNSVTANITSTTVDSNVYTSLSAITFSRNAKTVLEQAGILMHDDIYCDIIYYIGATLCRKEGKLYNLASNESGKKYNNGVQYKETVRFVKTNAEYYLKKPNKEETVLPSLRNNPCNHSISYPIYVYVLTQDFKRVDESQYDSDYSVPMANFRVDINVFKNDCTDTFKSKGEMEKHNGLEVFPVFREEYKLGTSSIENVKSDIYIDRGLNAAFERHLKLGEVATLESLEQYGLNYFKFMEN